MKTPARLTRPIHQTFGKIPYVLMAANPPLSVYSRAVFAAMDWHGIEAWPANSAVAKMAGCSLRQVRRAKDELLERGFLRRQSGRSGAVIVYVVDQNPLYLVWEPVTDRHRLRHDRDQQATPQALQAQVGGQPAPVSPPPTDRTPKTNSVTNSAGSAARGKAGPDPTPEQVARFREALDRRRGG